MGQGRYAQAEETDNMLLCLSNACRRQLIQYLVEEETPVKIETAAQRIKRWEERTTRTDDKPSQQDMMKSLWHHHLPKLADADIIALDTDKKTIQEGDRFTVAHSCLEEISRLR